MNQLIFTDFGFIVAVEVARQDQMQDIGQRVEAWVLGETKVLLLRLANWEIVDRRTTKP